MKNVYSSVLRCLCIILVSVTFFSPTVFANNSNLIASFVVNGTKKCLAGNQFEFTNNSTVIEGNTYNWDFGDGSTSTLTHPTKTYTEAGNYRIRLEVRNGTNYAFTEMFIDVMPTPEVDFVTLTNTLNGNSFTFISSSKIKSGNMNYSWDFGDSTSSTLINPTKTFDTAGIYNVKLTVTSDFGCFSSITKSITNNYTACATPVAAFTVNADKQCKKTNSFAFTNNSSAAAGTLSYVWNFADGTSSTEANPTKSFTNQGTYNVHLTVTNNHRFGCSTIVHKEVIVYGTNAEFTINSTAAECFKGNNSFFFTNSSNTNGNGLSYNWSYNNTTSTAVNPSTTYTAPGTYNVTLITTGSELNCADTLTKQLIIYPKPNANFSVNAANQCVGNNNFVFTNTSSISSTILNYEWYYGNGNSDITENASQQYAAKGTYTVTLIAKSEFDCRDTISKIVTVNNANANFTINSTRLQCLAGNFFTFNNNSNTSFGTLNYVWDLAEGTTSTAVSPTKSYSTPGTYTVTLIASTGGNCADTISKTLTVYPMPQVAFTTSQLSSNASTVNVMFNNASTISSGNNNYQWSFGDNTSSISVNPTHVFVKNVASRIVKLIAVSNHGCKDSAYREVSMLDGTSIPATPTSIASNTGVASGEIATINVYPNPVVHTANVNVITNTNGNINVRLMNHLGQMITSVNRNSIANTNNNIGFDMSSLPSGIYFVEARNTAGLSIGNFTISKN
jgi:PKD repeat protein